MFYSLLEMDVKTLIAALFWGNLTSVCLIASYHFAGDHVKDNRLSRTYLLAKICQTMAWFFLFFRNSIPDVLSVNFGNTLLLIGFYLEALAMFAIIQEESKWLYRLVAGILLCCAIAFNVVETLRADPSLRIIIASVCVFSILVIPNIKLLFARGITQFKRVVGLFYLLFLALLLPRAFYALSNPINIHSNALIQVLTFLALVMLMIFGLSAYLLLMKEQTDKIISTMATVDALTGLSNRYSFLDRADLAFQKHKVEGISLAILFLDIDFFKKINDTYGHSFGDEVLARFGSIIASNLRSRDFSCRYGGEEFLAFLSGVDDVNTMKITQRIMEQIAMTTFESNPEFRFAVSVGVIHKVPEGQDTLVEYINKADEALYVAKNTGRNKIVDYADLQAGRADGRASPSEREPDHLRWSG